MATPQNISMIDVTITLHGIDPTKPDMEQLEPLLRQYIHRLLTDLNIPAQHDISVKKSSKKAPSSRALEAISINGKQCRIPYTPERFDAANAKELASCIIDIILLNRELLVDPYLSQRICERVVSISNSQLKSLPPAEFQNLVTTMVKRGFKLKRCEKSMDAVDTSDWNYMNYFDFLIGDAASTSVRVWFNKEYLELYGQAAETQDNRFNEMYSMMRDGLFYELGIVYPEVSWEVDEELDSNEFRFQFNDVHYPSIFGLKPGEYLVDDTVDRLTLLKVKGTKVYNPANGTECAVIDESDLGTCDDAGLTTWDPLGYCILYLSHRLRIQAGSFLIRDLVVNELESLKQSYPVLVNTTAKSYDIFMLVWILRDLLDEGISIRDMRSILDNLLTVNGYTNADFGQFIVLSPEGTHLVPHCSGDMDGLTFSDYAGYLRARALKMYISHKYSRGQKSMIVYLLDPAIEEKIAGMKNGLSKKEHKQICDAIHREVGNLPPTAHNPVILTTIEIRRRFKKFIEIEFPYLDVLSHQELVHDMNIQPIAKISLEEK